MLPRGSATTAAVCLVLAACTGAAATGRVMTAHTVEGTTCLDGSTPYVYASVSPGVTDWVIQIGSQSISTDFCISQWHCALFAAPSAPAPAPAPMAVSNSGPQSSNCTVNPTFCTFNQAQIPTCTMDLLLGDADVQNGTTTMHFQGKKLLQAALKKFASLGMASAEHVLLNGVGWGGTSVILNADNVGTQLRALVPTLKDYRAVAADGVHPKSYHILWADNDGPGGNVGGKPYDALSGYLEDHFKLSNAGGSISSGCKAKHPSDPWMCMYVNETLPYLKTPLFLVNQLASIWDTFCNIDGVKVQNALQIECTPHGNDFAVMEWHYCFQYVNHGRPRTCTAPQITYVIKPFQEQYINETIASGLLSRPGNGAFYHSCHSGGYWVSGTPGQPGQWQLIQIEGVSAQQAVTNWWTAPTTAPSVFTKDCLWTENAPFICNKACAALPGPY